MYHVVVVSVCCSLASYAAYGCCWLGPRISRGFRRSHCSCSPIWGLNGSQAVDTPICKAIATQRTKIPQRNATLKYDSTQLTSTHQLPTTTAPCAARIQQRNAPPTYNAAMLQCCVEALRFVRRERPMRRGYSQGGKGLRPS